MTPIAPALLLSALALAACEREERQFRPPPPAANEPSGLRLSKLVPGSQSPPPAAPAGQRYEANAFHLSEGKRLYAWFNCKGCHANGGGGIGPALMDDVWIYGGDLASIAATIRDGRPNGMPSFRDLVPEEQIRQIAAYVRSMSGNVRKDAAPGRNDGLHPRPAENRLPRTQPPAAPKPEQ